MSITKLIKTMEKIKGLLPMGTYMIGYLLAFSLLEKRPARYTEIHVWLDEKIPFIEVFIIPYLMWFGFVALSVLFLYFNDRRNYDRMATMLYVGMTVFLVVSYLFPTIQYLRPRVMPRENIFTELVAFLYRTDTSTNIFPSIHVYNTLCCMAGLFRCRDRRAQQLPVRRGVMILGTSIILSTMFLKQHSVADVVGAFALFAPLYVLVCNYGVVIASRRAQVFAHR